MHYNHLDYAKKLHKTLLKKYPGRFDHYDVDAIRRYITYLSYLIVKIMKLKRDLYLQGYFNLYTKKTTSLPFSSTVKEYAKKHLKMS